jgi:hypothetical protein
MVVCGVVFAVRTEFLNISLSFGFKNLNSVSGMEDRILEDVDWGDRMPWKLKWQTFEGTESHQVSSRR